MSLFHRTTAEFLGTLWLVFAACGAAVLSPGGIGTPGVAMAFGLALASAIYMFGSLSGGHFNPAVSIGLWAAGRFPAKHLPLYVLAQLVGAVIAAGLLGVLLHGRPDSGLLPNPLAANGYGEHSPGSYGVGAALVVEAIASGFFVIVILGATRVPMARFAPLAIGLTLAGIHLFAIPVTNASVNPARSTGPALIQGGWALQQLWLFWAAPVAGGILGGLVSRALWPQPRTDVAGAAPAAY